MIEDQEGDKQKVLALAKKHASEHGFEGEAAEAFIEAFIENFDKGREEGERIGIEKMVKSLLKAHVDINVISATSGLTISEVEELND